MELNETFISGGNNALDEKEWSLKGVASGCHAQKPDILPKGEYILVSE